MVIKKMVQQFYEAQVYDEYVIKGNSAIFKCQIPSFVADHVEINYWTATSGEYYFPNSTGIESMFTSYGVIP
uniref:Ig-like domain-containing protein n=1 Tax=Megaselia scalaris TaxID=36166 RepID=T1GRB5_MEGSC